MSSVAFLAFALLTSTVARKLAFNDESYDDDASRTTIQLHNGPGSFFHLTKK